MNISKGRALENAISNSRSPWHCLYFSSSEQPVARTFLNSNKFYCLPTRPEYENSIHLHELIHVDGCQGLPQAAAYLASSMLDEYGMPDRYDDYEYFDLMFVYNAEVAELFEAVAYHFQIGSSTTPLDLKEGIIADLKVHDPLRFSLALQLNDAIKRLIDRKRPAQSEDDIWKLPLGVLRLTCGTKDWVKERVFDRFRVIRDLRPVEIPRWQSLDQLYNFLAGRLIEKEFQIVDMRSPYSVLNEANLWFWFRKLIRRMRTSAPLKPFIFGFLRQLDPSFGPIGFVTDSLDALSTKRVNYCHLDKNIHNVNMNKMLERRKIDLEELLSHENAKASKRTSSLLMQYKRALQQLESIKEDVSKMCQGLRGCKRKAECAIENEVYQKISRTWFSKDGQL